MTNEKKKKYTIKCIVNQCLSTFLYLTYLILSYPFSLSDYPPRLTERRSASASSSRSSSSEI